MKTYFLSFLLACFTTINLSARTQENITGTVVDENNVPMEFVSVALLNATDSSFVNGTTTDAKGYFLFDDLNSKKRLVRISSVGYKTVYINNVSANLGTITLTPDATMLGEVVVKSQLPKTMLKGDAMITNVQGSILEKSGKAEDMLNQIPGLTASDGSVTVFGRGEAEVYINGRQVRDDKELKLLSSDMVKNVEVVKVPGARYKANVKAVVRITTKKAVGEGWSVQDEVIWSHKYKHDFSNEIALTYRKSAWEFQTNLWASRNGYGNDSEVNLYTYLAPKADGTFNDIWHQKANLDNLRRAKHWAPTVQLSFNPNENHSAGLRYHYYMQPSSPHHVDMTSDVYRNKILQEALISNTRDSVHFWDNTINTYYNGRFGKWSVDFNGDFYFGRTRDNICTYEEGYDSSTLNGQSYKNDVHSRTMTANQMYAAKLAIAHPLAGGQLTFGGETSYTTRRNNNYNQEHIVDDDLSKINEDIYAGFLEYARQFGKVSMNAGLRYEHSGTKYYQFGKLMEEQSKSYDNLFPSFALSSQIFKSAYISAAYSYKVQRPSYENLASNTFYINRYSLQGGNPFLRPSFSHNASLTYAWQGLTVAAEYQNIIDEVCLLTGKYKEDPKVTLITPSNSPTYNNYALTVSYQKKFGVWTPVIWSAVRVQDYKAETPEGSRTMNRPIFNAGLQNVVQLPSGWRFNVQAFIQSTGEYQNIQLLRPTAQVSFDVYKSFFKDKLELRFKCNDIFKTSDQYVRVFNGARTLEQHNFSRRTIALTACYKFNQAKSKYRGQGAGQSQIDRMK